MSTLKEFIELAQDPKNFDKLYDTIHAPDSHLKKILSLLIDPRVKGGDEYTIKTQEWMKELNLSEISIKGKGRVEGKVIEILANIAEYKKLDPLNQLEGTITIKLTDYTDYKPVQGKQRTSRGNIAIIPKIEGEAEVGDEVVELGNASATDEQVGQAQESTATKATKIRLVTRIKSALRRGYSKKYENTFDDNMIKSLQKAGDKNLLHNAVLNSDVDGVNIILEIAKDINKLDEIINLADDKGHTALYYAADKPKIKALLEKEGAVYNPKDIEEIAAKAAEDSQPQGDPEAFFAPLTEQNLAQYDKGYNEARSSEPEDDQLTTASKAMAIRAAENPASAEEPAQSEAVEPESEIAHSEEERSQASVPEPSDNQTEELEEDEVIPPVPDYDAPEPPAEYIADAPKVAKTFEEIEEQLVKARLTKRQLAEDQLADYIGKGDINNVERQLKKISKYGMLPEILASYYEMDLDLLREGRVSTQRLNLTFLHAAIIMGKTEVVQAILNSAKTMPPLLKELLTQSAPGHRDVLDLAVENGDPKLIEEIIGYIVKDKSLLKDVFSHESENDVQITDIINNPNTRGLLYAIAKLKSKKGWNYLGENRLAVLQELSLQFEAIKKNDDKQINMLAERLFNIIADDQNLKDDLEVNVDKFKEGSNINKEGSNINKEDSNMIKTIMELPVLPDVLVDNLFKISIEHAVTDLFKKLKERYHDKFLEKLSDYKGDVDNYVIKHHGYENISEIYHIIEEYQDKHKTEMLGFRVKEEEEPVPPPPPTFTEKVFSSIARVFNTFRQRFFPVDTQASPVEKPVQSKEAKPEQPKKLAPAQSPSAQGLREEALQAKAPNVPQQPLKKPEKEEVLLDYLKTNSEQLVQKGRQLVNSNEAQPQKKKPEQMFTLDELNTRYNGNQTILHHAVLEEDLQKSQEQIEAILGLLDQMDKETAINFIRQNDTNDSGFSAFDYAFAVQMEHQKNNQKSITLWKLIQEKLEQLENSVSRSPSEPAKPQSAPTANATAKNPKQKQKPDTNSKQGGISR
jgi:hypothetical protein